MADVKLKKDCPWCGGKGKFHCGSSYFFERPPGGGEAVKMSSASISCRGCGMKFPRGKWYTEAEGGYPAAKAEVAKRWDKRL